MIIRRSKVWTEAREARLRELWPSGMRISDIAAQIGVSEGYISLHAGELGLPPRKGAGAQRPGSAPPAARLHDRACCYINPRNGATCGALSDGQYCRPHRIATAAIGKGGHFGFEATVYGSRRMR